MAGSRESAGEASTSRNGPSSNPVNTPAPHNLNGDTQMPEVNLQGYLNDLPIGVIRSRERNARIMYHSINWLINLLLISQAALSGVLVAVGAMEKKYQKVVAVLGAVNGVVTSILAIIKGQGLPGRYYQYAAGLRAVMREFTELNGRMEAGIVVTKQECDGLYESYNSVENENDRNTPDILNTGSNRATIALA